MAQGLQLQHSKFCCSLCLNLLDNPVTIPCGHNFCMKCITKRFDHENQNRIYSCPVCKEIFIQRPALVENSMLAFVMEELQAVGPRAELIQPCYAGPKDLACDICTGRKLKAVKSCLQCLASYCEDHLYSHLSLPALRNHQLVEGSGLGNRSTLASVRVQLKRTAQQKAPVQPHLQGSTLGRRSMLPSAVAPMKMTTQPEPSNGLELVGSGLGNWNMFSSVLEEMTGTPQPDPYIHLGPERSGLGNRNMFSSALEEVTGAAQPEPPVQLGIAACDLCLERNLNAIKSCLQCLLSYCQEHLQPHLSLPALRNHRLVDALADLQQSVCSQHQEVMKLFCRTDQCCICYICSKDGHKGHDKVSAAAEQAERQSELEQTRQKLCQRIQGKQGEVSLVQQQEKSVHNSAKVAVMDMEKAFTEHIQTVQQRLADMKEKVESRKKLEVGLFQKTQQKLEQDISTLRKTDADLQKLSTVEDPTYFLLNYLSLANLPEDSPTDSIQQVQHFEKLMVSVFNASEKLQEVLGEEYAKMSMAIAKPLMANPNTDPETRADFLQYACQVTLDPNTANPHLSLSNGNKKVVFVSGEQDYPKHPDRFAYTWQVLSKESLTGRCYLEVERSGKGVLVSMAYKSIGRAGSLSDCMFGDNPKSWALDCYKNSYEFRHNKVKKAISATWSPRVGVYLDSNAGVLCFYGISDTMTLLRKVQTTFTEPLHAGLWLSDGAAAELCSLQADP